MPVLVIRVHPALHTRNQARRAREHQAPREHPQMEARLWALHVHYSRARRTRSRYWQTVHLRVRQARQTGTVHVPGQTEHRRDPATDPLCLLGHGACHRAHGPWRRVRVTFFVLHLSHRFFCRPSRAFAGQSRSWSTMRARPRVPAFPPPDSYSTSCKRTIQNASVRRSLRISRGLSTGFSNS